MLVSAETVGFPTKSFTQVCINAYHKLSLIDSFFAGISFKEDDEAALTLEG